MKYSEINKGELEYKWRLHPGATNVSGMQACNWCGVAAPLERFADWEKEIWLCQLCANVTAVNAAPPVQATANLVLRALGHFDDVEVVTAVEDENQ